MAIQPDEDNNKSYDVANTRRGRKNGNRIGTKFIQSVTRVADAPLSMFV